MDDLNQSGLSENSACGLAYITIIPAIIFLIVAPYNKIPNVRFHSWQSIFLCLAWIVINIVLRVFGAAIPFAGFLVWALIPLVGLGLFILWLIVMINAFNGKRFKVPVLYDLAEKQANS
jgi:uncharacterized membrane protein